MIPYLNLAVYVCLSSVAGFFASSLHVSTWLLQGLHSYLYPETHPGQGPQEAQGGSGFKDAKWKEVQSSVKDASANEGEGHGSPALSADGEEEKLKNSKGHLQLKKREQKRKDKSKEKFRWEEGSSQIYRLTLTRTHLMGRLYFAEYDQVIVYAMVGLANLVSHEGLSLISHSLHMLQDEQARKFDIVPFMMGLFAVYKIVRLLAQVGWRTSTSRASELILSIGVGFLGFVVALCVLFFASSFVLDMGLESLLTHTTSLRSSTNASDSKWQTGLFVSAPTLARLLISIIAGLLTGVLVAPAHRVVRAFWSGTDQLQWNMPMAKMGPVVRFLLHLNIALPVFVSIMWIKPMGELFVASESPHQEQIAGVEGKIVAVYFWGKLLLPAPSDDWARDFGLSRNLFAKVQFLGLAVAGLLSAFLFRVNVQAYLNEALVVWYEGLHRSKVMNLELTRAKLLLNSYFLCRAAIQCFVPGMLVMLLVGMSRVWGDVPLSVLAGSNPNLFFLRVVTLFLAWWATFSWSILTSVTLAMYRAGLLLVS